MSYIGRKPWHRLPYESDRAYSAFCLFLNMGSTRSLYNLVTSVYTPPLSVEELTSWSSKFAWTKRAELCEQFILNELLNGDTYPSDNSVCEYPSDVATTTTQAARKLLADNFPVKRKVRYNAL